MRRGKIIQVGVLVAACSIARSQTEQSPSVHMSFKLSSPAFTSGGAIPREYTCDGVDQSPQLRWTDAPAGTAAFALVMHDPDAPVGDWVHWVIWNIPPSENGMEANIAKAADLPNGARQGRNDFRKLGYNGPCPPARKVHKYLFHLYAVDTKIDLSAETSRPDLESALKGHVLAEAEYMGTYHR